MDECQMACLFLSTDFVGMIIGLSSKVWKPLLGDQSSILLLPLTDENANWINDYGRHNLLDNYVGNMK